MVVLDLHLKRHRTSSEETPTEVAAAKLWSPESKAGVTL